MPRSASRDLADRFSGNRRYFRNWTRIERWKLGLSLMAFVAVMGWAAASYFARSRFDYQATHGGLASVHAAWNHQCDACHVPNVSDTYLLDAHTRWNTFTCEKCHAGPAHADNMAADYKLQNCADCHRDHQGAAHSLVRLSDDSCTACHGELAKYAKTASKIAQKVTSFANDHPEFTSLTNVPRTLNFSHAQHMTPGIPTAANQKPDTLFSFAEATRRGFAGVDRYRKGAQKSETDIVSLDCQSCHVPEGNGRTFQPVNYESHCAACHPTMVGSVAIRNEAKPAFAVPHGKASADYDAIIAGQISRMLQANDASLAKSPPIAADDPRMKSLTEAVNATTRDVKMTLLKSCEICHDRKGDTIVPTVIPKVWFRNVKFDHAAHRSANCISCHEGAFQSVSADGVREVPFGFKARDADIKGLASCRECHASQQSLNGQLVGGIRHGCTDCHYYHQADHPDRRLLDMLSPKRGFGSPGDFTRGGRP
jgi:hypothetical protein